MSIVEERNYKVHQISVLQFALDQLQDIGEELPKKIEKKEDVLLDTADFQDAFEETDDSISLYSFPRKTITTGVYKGQTITEELNVISQFNNFIVYEYDNIGSDQVKLDRLQFIFNNIESTITRLQTVLEQFGIALANGDQSITQEQPQDYQDDSPQDYQGNPEQFQETPEQNQGSQTPTVFF